MSANGFTSGGLRPSDLLPGLRHGPHFRPPDFLGYNPQTKISGVASDSINTVKYKLSDNVPCDFEYA